MSDMSLNHVVRVRRAERVIEVARDTKGKEKVTLRFGLIAGTFDGADVRAALKEADRCNCSEPKGGRWAKERA